MNTSSPTPVGAPHIHYVDDVLFIEGCAANDLIQRFGSPLYVYSHAALEAAYRRYVPVATPHDHVHVCYGMKANSNLAVLQTFARLGAGFDIVSGGELARVIAAGGNPSKVVFSGVGKQEAEIVQALRAGVLSFNVESMGELHRLSAVATQINLCAPISLRVNPDVDAATHPYISTGLKDNKFGIAHDIALEAYALAQQLPGLRIVGIDCHIGSQIQTLAPFLDALERMLDLVDGLHEKGIRLEHLDLGGGVGVCYHDETPLAPTDLIRAVRERMTARGHGHLQLLLEPGRSLAANAGLLLTTVNYLKPCGDKHFAIVDAAMNDLLRPALYEAWHGVLPIIHRQSSAPTQRYDIVGPVCETGDWLARDRQLALTAGDGLAIESAGAYGMTMASNYNTRPRAAEVMVRGGEALLIRKREILEDLWRDESMLPD